MTYAKDTSVSVAASKAELEKILQRYGASAFMSGWDQQKAVIGFEITGKRYRVVLPLPKREEFSYTETGRARTSRTAIEAAWEQACRQRWRALALWIKALLEAAEVGIVTVDQALMMMEVLPSGQTVGEWIEPKMEDARLGFDLPPLLPIKV